MLVLVEFFPKSLPVGEIAKKIEYEYHRKLEKHDRPPKYSRFDYESDEPHDRTRLVRRVHPAEEQYIPDLSR